MRNLVKTWLRRNRKGTYVYYLRWIGEDGKEKYQSLGHSDKRDADHVTYKHCEQFHQYCFDKELRPASGNSHMTLVKRIFSLAVKRGQLEQNPFCGLALLKVPKKAIRLFSNDEFERILAAARQPIWKARLLLAKTAALRKGEVLNLTLNDIDFVKGKVIVQPKDDTRYTWRWVVKDKDRREVPLIDKVAQLLIGIQTELPEGQPYLLLPPNRYRYLMALKELLSNVVDEIFLGSVLSFSGSSFF